MKKVKLSLVAIALIGGLSAFATRETASAQQECPDQPWVDQNCLGNETTCCIVGPGQTLIDRFTDEEVGENETIDTEIN